MTSPVLIDVILLAALLFFVLMGAKRGFILTLCSLVAVVVALVGANLAADPPKWPMPSAPGWNRPSRSPWRKRLWR